MNKININGLTQGCTAEQLNAIAMNIYNRKGDVDMSNCNVTITPPSGMSPGMAGIIVKCASEQNGTVNISGHTEIDDETWAKCKEYGTPLWMIDGIKYSIPLDVMFDGGILEGLPRFPDDATITEEKMWYAKYPISTLPDNWYLLKYADYVAWGEKSMSGFGGVFGNSNIIAAKFFHATSVPTGYKYHVDEVMNVYIDGVLVHTIGTKGSEISGTASFDYSQYIKEDRLHLVCITCNDTGGGNCAYFGFTS